MQGYLQNENKDECSGCESCVQICPKNAITMEEDSEKFRYPFIDMNLCINCGLCHKVCPYENPLQNIKGKKIVFGGYHKNNETKGESTSGGAFSAIVDAWCDRNYVIFGAVAEGLNVYHTYTEDKNNISRFRKSKYMQSNIGVSYKEVRAFLKEGKKVLFSGTPCQIAGLKLFLQNVDTSNLLTIEVICEGVPTPHFMNRFEEWLEEKHGSKISILDYRFKDMKRNLKTGKWDFEVMYTELKNGKIIKTDRWFNPFWSIWLNHLMSRPSCYKCPYAKTERNADITLGDLWGVHIYCPELYGRNAGSSLILCNTNSGVSALNKALPNLHGHILDFDKMLKYQSPLRKHIDVNPKRNDFMKDVAHTDYKSLCKKWAVKPSLKLLYQKYIWGNRQKMYMWNLRQSIKKRKLKK